MKSPGVFIIGDFTSDRLGASYKRAFTAIGHQVDGFDISLSNEFLAYPGKNRFLHRITMKSLLARRLWSKRLNAKVYNSVKSSPCKFVFVLNGEWLMPETVRSMQRIGKRVAIFHADNPLPPHYNNRPETLLSAKESDLYLIWSERLAQELRDVGIKKVAYMPFGWDPEIFPYQQNLKQGTWPGAVFIGGWDREREEFLNEVSAHVPLHIYGPSYWGNRTKRNSRSRKHWMGQSLTMTSAAQTIREAAVTLNILRTQHSIESEPTGVIMRHFEVPGAGGFLLSSISDDASKLFEKQKHADYFSNVRECISLCKHYIRADAERRDLAERGHDLISKKHKYINRAKEIIDLVDFSGC